jgi:purine-binding chemotaxis protein CheW
MATSENATPATPQLGRPHLVFALGGDDYVVAISQVRELIPAAPLTRLPGAPPWVRGVFNLRGAVVPLVDLGVKLGIGTSAATVRTSWLLVELMVERRRELLAIEADEVRAILELADAELLETPALGIRIERELVRGVVPCGDGFGLVLDLERVLTAPAPSARRTPGETT